MSTTHGKWGMNYSPTFWRLAIAAAERAQAHLGDPSRPHEPGRNGAPIVYTPHAAEAVIMSVVTLEAGINEIAVWARNGFGGPCPTLPDDFMRQRLTDKWGLVPKTIVGKEFNRGKSPWQDFSSLVGLRDELVHFKWHREKVPSFMRSLVAKDLVLPENPAIYWTDAVQTDRVAVWAVNTTLNMFDMLADLMGRRNDATWTWPVVPQDASP